MKRIFNLIVALALILVPIAESHAQVSLTASAGTTSGSYTTLNAAFAAINAGTHQGAINITITGNTTEPSPPTSLVGSGVGSASYTSIFISPSGGSWTINSAALPFAYRGIIELFGAKHVTIDGDPAQTGTRHLSLQVAMTSDINTSVIRMASTDTSGLTGAAYDTVRNCNIIGGRDSANSTTPSYGIVISGNSATSITTPVASDCSYNAFINNTFTRSYASIYLWGASGNTLHGNNSTLIYKNYFGTDSASTSNIYAIYAEYFHPSNGSIFAVIDSNDFTGTLTSSSYSFYGIYSLYNYGSLFVRGNNFHNINAPHGISGLDTYSGAYIGNAGVYAPLDFSGNIMQNCTSGGNTTLIYQNVPNQYNIASQWNIHNNTINNISCSTSSANVLGGFVLTSVTGSGGPDTLNIYNNLITNLSGGCNLVGIAYDGSSKLSAYDNVINGFSTTNSACFAVGIYAFSGKIYNNMISDLSAAPLATVSSSNPGYPGLVGIPASAIGIEANGSGARVYENSIALNTANQAGAAVNAFSAAVYYNNSSSKFEDNILYNSQNSSNAYGFYASSVATFSSDTLDYNAYYVPYGSVGYIGSAEETLADWQAATAQDIHSTSGPVPFHAIKNLHIDTNSAYALPLFHTGTYIAAVSTDIDGQTRNNPPCIGADEFTAVNVIIDSVWPGDADDNRLVDNTDLLPIGLAYDSTGPARTGASIVWQAQAAADWSEVFSVYAPLVNFKHADCNGDGIVNASDTTAIMTNFGLSHPKTNGTYAPWRSGFAGLEVSFNLDTVNGGDTLITSFILGDSLLSVNNIAGIAFTYNYDPTVVDTTMVSFSFIPSWLAGSSDAISISRNFLSAGTLKAAITRIDHTNRSGAGVIALMYSRITTDNINGKDLAYYTNRGFISDIVAIDAAGNPITLNAGLDSDQVAYTPTGIHDLVSNTNIDIYPNPARDQIRVVANSMIQEISISDLLGKNVIVRYGSNNISENIRVTDLSDGIYVVRVVTDMGMREIKLTIQH